MADIIRFPTKTDPKEEAMRALARKLAQHLTVAMYDRGILDIPAQAFVAEMVSNLLSDGFDYDASIIAAIGESPEMLKRLESLFITTLVDRGYIPQSKA